jgi:hypothetical protein
VDDRREGQRFTSAFLPPWARRSPKITEVLPVLHLRGVSTKDFVPALADFFGSEAGLSASTISRLTREWSLDLERFKRRDLSPGGLRLRQGPPGCISTSGSRRSGSVLLCRHLQAVSHGLLHRFDGGCRSSGPTSVAGFDLIFAGRLYLIADTQQEELDLFLFDRVYDGLTRPSHLPFALRRACMTLRTAKRRRPIT